MKKVIKDTRWKKGCPRSNPRGRPRKGHSIADQLRAAASGPARKRLVRSLIEKAENGNLRAIELLFAYLLGKPQGEPLVHIDMRQQDSQHTLDLTKLSDADLELLHQIVQRANPNNPLPPPTPAPLRLPAPRSTSKPEPPPQIEAPVPAAEAPVPTGSGPGGEPAPPQTPHPELKVIPIRNLGSGDLGTAELRRHVNEIVRLDPPGYW
ncbi:MAG: DUF5681 domain-containing protein [Bryobacteraceae bacterium]